MERDRNCTSICQMCKFGVKPGESEKCGNVEVLENPRSLLEDDQQHRDLLASSIAVAESKGIRGFNPMAYIAPSLTLGNDECRYFEKRS